MYEDSDDDTDTDDVFESLVIDIEREDRTTPMDDPTPVAGTNDDLIASYHMSIGDLSPANAAVMVEGLATKAFTHFLDPQADIASYVLSASDRYGPDTLWVSSSIQVLVRSLRPVTASSKLCKGQFQGWN
jgi:hypothetical protein